jgi:hypothetical protein
MWPFEQVTKELKIILKLKFKTKINAPWVVLGQL